MKRTSLTCVCASSVSMEAADYDESGLMAVIQNEFSHAKGKFN